MNGINVMEIKVAKRDGSHQSFDLDKVHKVLEWAVEDITGVSMSEIELKANIQLYDKYRHTIYTNFLLKVPPSLYRNTLRTINLLPRVLSLIS